MRPTLPLVAAPPDEAGRRERARLDGCLYLPGLLPAARLEPLCRRVDEALARRGWRIGGRSDPAHRLGAWDDPRWTAFLAEILPSEPYRALAAAPELLAVIRLACGGEPELHVGDVCRLVSPGAPDLTTPPHQDAAYLPEAAEVWTAWLPLGPCPKALGPLALLPGSHLGGLRPHAAVHGGGGLVGAEVEEDAPWRAADLAPGDVLLFSALTLHCALPNATPDELRVSVDYRYRPQRRPG